MGGKLNLREGAGIFLQVIADRQVGEGVEAKDLASDS